MQEFSELGKDLNAESTLQWSTQLVIDHSHVHLSQLVTIFRFHFVRRSQLSSALQPWKLPECQKVDSETLHWRLPQELQVRL